MSEYALLLEFLYFHSIRVEVHTHLELVYQTLGMPVVLHSPQDREESIPKNPRRGMAENISGTSCVKTLDPRNTDTVLSFSFILPPSS